MVHLTSSAHNADQRLSNDVDAQAEREAQAMAWMEENMEIEQPKHRYRVLAMHVEDAAELGLPPVQHHRYPTLAAMRAHEKIIAAFANGRACDRVIPDKEVTTRSDRERRAARRLERAAMLRTLEKLPEPTVPRRGVGSLVGAADRTICTAILKGELPVIGSRTAGHIPVTALVKFLRRRVA